MRHCMVDIETLATHQRAAILQIGAVEFDPFVPGSLGSRYEARVAVKDQGRRFGRVVDIATIQWWMDDPEREGVFRKLLKGEEPLGKALHGFAEWYKGIGIEAIWANSPTFDLAILRSAYEDIKHPVPWHYREERDFRTLMRVVFDGERVQVANSALSGLPPHDALGDAWRQARLAQEAYVRLASCRADGWQWWPTVGGRLPGRATVALRAAGVGGVDSRPVGVVESGAPAGTQWRWATRSEEEV